MRWIISLFAALVFCSTAGAQPAPRYYGVIFEVNADAEGKVTALKINKVIDPAAGTAEAVNVAVPAEYVSAVQAWLRQRRTYEPNEHFFTWTFFDPARPTKADINPKEGRS